MKILVATDRYLPEPVLGYERFMASLATHLASRGHAVTVAARLASEEMPASQMINGVEVRRYKPAHVPDHLWMFGRSIRKAPARHLLRHFNNLFDVMIGPPPYVQMTARHAPSLKRVYAAGGTLLGAEFLDRPSSPTHSLTCRIFEEIAWQQLLWSEKRCIRMANLVVVPSENVKNQLVHYYGQPGECICTIPHGADLDEFLPATHDSGGVLRILTVGRLDKVKNHLLLIEALSRAKNREKMLVRIVGSGKMRDSLESRARDLRITARVELVDHCSDIQVHYQWADVFVLPSLCEPFGIVLVEAMACGLPCIGLRSAPPRIWTACEEIIEDGVTGMVLPSAEPEGLARALDTYCHRPHLVRKMGLAGRARAIRHFTWTEAARKYEEILLNLIGSSK
jgi:glycosyltransferase involved in cell wall biosynthesis